MSFTQTYSLAHTARCKLQLAADRPDRNLRFILGHAFTLDNLRLRLAEIEMEGSDDDESSEEHSPTPERHVSFRGNSNRHVATYDQKRSPPPDQPDGLEDEDSGSSDDEDEEKEGGDDLSLRRFESAAAKPTRVIGDDEQSRPNKEERRQSLPMPSEDELKMITSGASNAELADLYQRVAGCPCHGENGPMVSNVWEVPQKPGYHGSRVTVVEVDA
jgi:hypothetical protein